MGSKVPQNYSDWKQINSDLYTQFALNLIDSGVMLEPDSRESWFICETHQTVDLKWLEQVAEKSKYVVLVNEKGIALSIIKQLARHDIASFMLLNSLNDKDLTLLSAKEKHLLKGSIIPNNYNAGKKLLNGLVIFGLPLVC